jgi:hypothetical protein
MPKKIPIERECELIGELTNWLIQHSPGCISEQEFRKVVTAFLKGYTIVLRSDVVKCGS